jgi:hypothetical protein
MKSTTYQKFVRRWEEVTDLPPQTVGPFTPFYRWIAKHLKIMPWPALVLASVGVVIALYLILGTAITFLVSLLQRGF